MMKPCPRSSEPNCPVTVIHMGGSAIIYKTPVEFRDWIRQLQTSQPEVLKRKILRP